MKTEFDMLRQTRKNILGVASRFDKEQLVKIPEGYKNNILWNVGHVVITQKLLTYKLSNLPIGLDESLIEACRKGSTPANWEKEIDFEYVKNAMFTAVDKTEKDYKTGKFTEFSDYETSYGVTLTSVEDAIKFNNLHEALHLGYIMSLAKNI